MAEGPVRETEFTERREHPDYILKGELSHQFVRPKNADERSRCFEEDKLRCVGFVYDARLPYWDDQILPDNVLVYEMCNILTASSFGPFHSQRNIKNLEIVSKEEALEHYRGLAQHLGNRAAEVGGLVGAVDSSKRHFVEGMVERISHPHFHASNYGEAYEFHPKHVSRPKTGIYVVLGHHEFHPADFDHPELVIVKSSIPNKALAEILFDMHPKGFGSIPATGGKGGHAPCPTSLVGYQVFEVPDGGLSLIEGIDPAISMTLTETR